MLNVHDIIERALLETRISISGKMHFLYKKIKNKTKLYDEFHCVACENHLNGRSQLFTHNRSQEHIKMLQKLENKANRKRY